MAIYYPQLEQGTPEWHALRIRPTASRFGDLVTPSGKPSASATAYLAEILAAYYGNPKPFFVTPAMEWGTATEDAARMRYELEEGADVTQTGIVLDREERFSPACSPDGLVGDDGGIEIKCPETWTHLQTILAGKIPAKHIAQTQGFLFVTGRDWIDFVSFDPRLPAHLQYFCQRQFRDEKYIAALDAATYEAQERLLKLTGESR